MQDYTPYVDFIFQDFWRWAWENFPDLRKDNLKDVRAAYQLYKELLSTPIS